MLLRQLAAGLAGATLLTGVSALVIPATANAAPQTGHGYPVPAQKYLNNPDPNDWMGSYMVAGKQVWCVNFALKAPEPNEPYQPGQTLQTKWNTALDPTIAAEISFLLLRFGNTSSDDEAAALAHLLHTWTAAPQTPDQLN